MYKHEIVLTYIKTLWPILLTAGIVLMGYSQLEARVTVLERNMEYAARCIESLEGAQAETNINLAEIRATLESVDHNVERLLNRAE